MAPMRSFAAVPLSAVLHEDDRRGDASLRSSRIARWALRQLVQAGYEHALRRRCAEDGVRVGPSAYPVLHELLRDVCRALDVVQPETYVIRDDRVAAAVRGVETPVLSITTGALVALGEPSMAALVAHELMHMKARHLPWLLLHEFLLTFSEELGLAATALRKVQAELLAWRRAAVLSCDRGALVLLGGAPGLDELLRLQAGEVSAWGGVLPGAWNTPVAPEAAEPMAWASYLFPLPLVGTMAALRRRELMAWKNGSVYQQVVAGTWAEPAEDPDAASAQADDAGEGEPPLWGAFAPPGCETEEADAPCPCRRALGQLWQGAEGAGRLAQDGAKVVGTIAAAFWETFRGEVERLGRSERG